MPAVRNWKLAASACYLKSAKEVQAGLWLPLRSREWEWVARRFWIVCVCK